MDPLQLRKISSHIKNKADVPSLLWLADVLDYRAF